MSSGELREWSSSERVKMVCERDDALLSWCSDTARLHSPSKRSARAFSSLAATCEVSPFRTVFLSADGRRAACCLGQERGMSNSPLGEWLSAGCSVLLW